MQITDISTGIMSGLISGLVVILLRRTARLLAEKPAAKDVAVAGMPLGAPVMGGAPDTYDVVLFGPAGLWTLARYRGSQEI